MTEFEQEVFDLLDEKADIKHQHIEKDIVDLDRMRYKGRWLNSWDYEANDVIISQDKTYICIANHKDQRPPNTTFWELIAVIKAEKAVKVIGVGGGGAVTTPGTGGVSDHSLLTNLAYATSGHTGFLPDSHLTDFTHSDIAHSNRSALDAVLGVNTGDQDLSSYLKSGDNVSELVNDAGYLTSFTETDPVFGISPAAGIDALDIGYWNTAYGWGDHASVGYLTSESDPLSVHLNQSTPQNITGGQPDFNAGLRAGSTDQFSIDASGNVLTTGTLGAGAITGTSLIKSGGTSSQFLKADGSVDTSTYLTSLSGAVLTSQASPQTIGDTTNRLLKLWATDITITNKMTGSITGNADGTSAGLAAQYIDWSSGSGGNSIANKPTLGNWSTLAYPTWASGTPFVKMTAAGTFALDTSTYLTGNQSISLSGAVTGSGTTAITTSLAENIAGAGNLKGASSTKLANGSSGNLLKSLGDGTFGWDTSTYLTSLSGALLATGATTGATSQAQVFTNTLQITALTASKVVFTDASKNLTSTGIGTSSQFIKGDGSLDSSTYLTSVTAHNLLSATHGDTTAGTCVRGDVIIGDVNTKWIRLAFPATPTGKVLIASATDVTWSANALGTAAYTASGDYATAAQGTLATNAIPKGLGTNIGDLITFSAASTPARIADVAVGSYFASGGVNTIPFWTTLNQAAVAGLTTANTPNFAGLKTTTNRAQLQGNSVTGFTGAGLELGYDGTNGVITVFDRTTPSWKALNLSGLSIGFGILSGTPTSALIDVDGEKRLGIGRTNPEYALDVVGWGYFSGEVFASDFLYNSPFFTGNALEEVKRWTYEAGTEKDNWAEVDHSSFTYSKINTTGKEKLSLVDNMAILIKAVQEQQAKIEELELKIEVLEQKLTK